MYVQTLFRWRLRSCRRWYITPVVWLTRGNSSGISVGISSLTTYTITWLLRLPSSLFILVLFIYIHQHNEGILISKYRRLSWAINSSIDKTPISLAVTYTRGTEPRTPKSGSLQYLLSLEGKGNEINYIKSYSTTKNIVTTEPTRSRFADNWFGPRWKMLFGPFQQGRTV
jgi:hypothetical protein